MFTPFAHAARAVTAGPLTWRTWTGLIALPVLIAGLLTWAFWNPLAAHGAAKAAVVNSDVPVTVNGQIIPIGRELAGKLTHSADSSYTWVLTDADDAREGLADGTYAAAVTIPPNFSARATSISNKNPLTATQATLQIETSQHAGLLDPLASKQVAQATMATLNTQVVQTYLDNIYIGFNTIHHQLNAAADGADQLAAGTGKLSTGAHSLAGGAAQLNTAAHQLSSGASQLASGTSTLSGGLSQAEKETANLPALTQQLAAGARQVANGNKQLAAVIVPLADKVIHAIDTLPSAQAAAARFQQLAAQCQSQDPAFCRQLSQLANRFSAEAKLIDSGRNSIRAAAVAIKNNIQALAAGAGKVAAGTALLASKSGQLAGGIASAAGGARKLDTGAHQLASGAGQLAGGSATLSSGANQLAGGVASANVGAQKLSSGLDAGRDQIPSYDPQQRAHLKTVAATPVGAQASGATDFGRTAAALFIALALWCCALATYVITRAVPTSVLMSREPTWRTILYAAQPGTAVAVIAAAVLSLVFIPILGLGLGRSLAFFLVTLLAALTFTAINQAIVAIFQRPGRFAAIAIMLLTLATGIVSTVPPVFSAVEAVLPTHGAVEALRAIATGTGGTTTGVTELIGWLILGTIASIVVTDRRRTLPATHLRLSSAH